MRGSRSFWSMNTMMSPPAEQNYCLLPCQDPPLSWSQLMLNCCSGGSYASEEEKHDTELIEGCWEEQIGNAGTGVFMADAGSVCMIQSPAGSSEVIQPSKCSWSHQILPPSISTTLSNNLLEFSSNKSHHNSTKPADSSSECNGTATGGALKKARVQGSFIAQSTLKVRKEKLGDRITALHQIVSPFGKTDTASVLLEAIGYIRFLQSQIEALTSPYLSSASGNMKQPPTFDDHESRFEEEKDLRSRGLCLMPLPYISHVGRDFGGNYWGSF